MLCKSTILIGNKKVCWGEGVEGEENSLVNFEIIHGKDPKYSNRKQRKMERRKKGTNKITYTYKDNFCIIIINLKQCCLNIRMFTRRPKINI